MQSRLLKTRDLPRTVSPKAVAFEASALSYDILQNVRTKTGHGELPGHISALKLLTHCIPCELARDGLGLVIVLAKLLKLYPLRVVHL